MQSAAEAAGLAYVCPPVSLCTDNAAMVAGLGAVLLERQGPTDLGADAFARVEGPLAGRTFRAKAARAPT